MQFWFFFALFWLAITMGCSSAPVGEVPDAEKRAAVESRESDSPGQIATASEAAAEPETTDETAEGPSRSAEAAESTASKPPVGTPASSGQPMARAGKKDKPAPPSGPHPGLRDPSLATGQAPSSFRARFETTRGDFTIEVQRDWAPRGADRFYNLIQIGYFDDIAFFRVISGFIAQFGLHGDPAVNAAWKDARIQDDSVAQSNQRGYVSFATGGPNTRTTQLFINFANNARLDTMGFSPFGRVVEGMDVVDALYADYGEGAPHGSGPAQPLIGREGNAYLKSRFPQLDYIKRAYLVK